MFGSTYKFISKMKNVKSAERNRLSDKHLTGILRIGTSINVDINEMLKVKQ